jgi:hypothetical protein
MRNRAANVKILFGFCPAFAQKPGFRPNATGGNTLGGAATRSDRSKSAGGRQPLRRSPSGSTTKISTASMVM